VACDARVVDQHVEPSVPRDDVGEGGGDRVLVGDVAQVEARTRRLRARSRVDVDDRHRRPLLGHPRADRRADAVAAAGDDGDLPVESHAPPLPGRVLDPVGSLRDDPFR
jgi:hypothetical protein